MSDEVEAGDLSKISVDVEIRHEVKVDLVTLIMENLDEYYDVDMNGGYCDWERPSVFLTEYLAERTDNLGPGDGGAVADGYSNVDVDFRWTEAHWRALLTVCPKADPEWSPNPEDVARRPGPLDVPLPLEMPA